MRWIACGLFGFLVLCGVSPGCAAQAPAGEEADFHSGEWWGGFGLMDGDRLHWTHFTATLRAEGRRVTGEGVYVAGPERGRLTDKTIGISGRVQGGRLRLRLTYGKRQVDCDADHDAESATGSCRVDGEEQPLRLVRVEPFDPSRFDTVQGVYEFDESHRVLIGRINPIPMMLDLPSGEVRMLFSKGEATWIAGPRLLVGHPEQWRLHFAGDELTVQRDGGPVAKAERRPGSTEEPFSFSSEHDGVELHGTLYLPAAAGPHPGIVWVHGSGKTPRTEAMFFPMYLTDLGFAVLAFDKRGVVESGGSYEMPDGSTFNEAFLRRRAKDVASAMNALRHHPGVDGKRIGLFGISQAGWVMPIAASSTECAFTISLSGGATRLSQEGHFSELTDEMNSDASLPTIADAIAEVRARAPQGHDWGEEFASQRCPGLWLYGLQDRINPSQLCVEVLEAVKEAHGKDFTIVQFPRGNHPLMESRLGGHAESLLLSRFVPGMFTTIETWLEEKGFRSAPAPRP